MLRLIIFFSFIFLNIKIVLADNNFNKYQDCSWANTEYPCLKIEKKINNTSKLNEPAIYKYTITKDDIEKMGATDVVDVLKKIPGISLTQSGPTGQQTSVFLRGSNSNHTLVMINGIPVNDQSTTQGLHDFGVDFIQTIQQVEVYPGSSGTLFGTNAIGGAINFVLTGDYKDKINIQSDKNGNYNFSSNKTFIEDNTSLNIKLGIVDNETISARSGSSTDKDRLQNYTTNINYEKFTSPSNKIFSTLYLRETIAEYDGSSTNQWGYEGDNKMLSLQTGLNNTKQDSNNSLVLYYNLYDREYDEKGIIDNYYSYVAGGKFDYSGLFNERTSYGFGGDYKYEWGDFENRGSYSASTKGNSDNLAIFGNLGYEFFEKTYLSFFVRNDNHKITSNNRTYKLSLNKKFSNFDIGVARMTGLRNPSLYELFGTDSFGYSGNKSLDPEKSISNEITFNYNFNDKIKFSTNLFRTSIKNNIEYSSNKYINDNDNIDLIQKGVDSHIEFGDKNLNYNFFSSYLSSKTESGADQLRRPSKRYGFNIYKKIGNDQSNSIDLNLSYTHYGKHFDTHSSTFARTEMDSTDIMDIKLSKNYGNFISFIKITNLLNETYQRPHGYNQEKRYLKFGINY